MVLCHTLTSDGGRFETKRFEFRAGRDRIGRRRKGRTLVVQPTRSNLIVKEKNDGHDQNDESGQKADEEQGHAESKDDAHHAHHDQSGGKEHECDGKPFATHRADRIRLNCRFFLADGQGDHFALFADTIVRQARLTTDATIEQMFEKERERITDKGRTVKMETSNNECAARVR